MCLKILKVSSNVPTSKGFQLKPKPNYFSYAYFLVLDYITPDCHLLDTIYASIPAMPFNRDCFSYLMPFPCLTNHTVSEAIYRVHSVK